MNKLAIILLGLTFFNKAHATSGYGFYDYPTNDDRFKIESKNALKIKEKKAELKFESLSLSNLKLKQLVLKANMEFKANSVKGLKIKVGNKQITPTAFKADKNLLRIDFDEEIPYDTCTFKINFEPNINGIKTIDGEILRNQAPLVLRVFAFKEQPQKYKNTHAQVFRKDNDVILGWDWSLPAGTIADPKASTLGNINMPPSVTKLSVAELSWRELEPTEGVYDFQKLANRLNSLRANGRKVQLRIKASVLETKYFENGKERTEPGTSPKWLANITSPDTITKVYWDKKINSPTFAFQITSYNIFDPIYVEKYNRFIDALGKTGLMADTIVYGAYLHGMSASRGEEASENFDLNSPEGLAWQSIIKNWSNALGKDIHKLAYPGSRNDWLQFAFAQGLGQRNGFIEMYLRFFEASNLGASLDKNGYALFNDNLAPIKEGRMWGDENEEYGDNWESRFGNPLKYPHRFKESWMRALESRRSSLWTGPHTYDPEFSYWCGLELGRNAGTSPDAWSYLRESYLQKGKNYTKTGPKRVKNFERWLYQRDLPEYPTEAVFRVDHGYKANAVDLERQYDLIGRKGKRFGFGVDDNFISPTAKNKEIAIKLTYQDNGNGKLYLKYANNGTDKLQSIDMENTGLIKTATFFIKDADFNQTDYTSDFYVYVLDNNQEKDLTLFLARIIKASENKQ